MKKIIGDILFFGLCGVLTFMVLCQVGLLPFRLMYVRSGSMSPTILPGDLAFISVSPNIAIDLGDIVLFDMAGEPVIHRVVAIESGHFTTQGDANSAPDSGIVTQVRGKVLFVIPKLGYAVAFFQTGMKTIFKPGSG
jgi:signal peptidase I